MRAVLHFVYDEQGQLVGEYDQNGNAVNEYVWFQGMPVAVIQAGKPYYIHSDHLNTPRAVLNQSGQVVWLWDDRGFGDEAANEDPDGNGIKFTFNLRFPGQYADAESGLYYNWHRTYNPNTGRYVTSDPIGLGGGTNTYLYAEASPLLYRLRWLDGNTTSSFTATSFSTQA
jgi:RHS repeat-associated protein